MVNLLEWAVSIPTVIFLVMVLVCVIAEVSDFVFKIHSNKYYSVFHFVGGGLTYLLILSITKNSCISLFGVLVVGVLWEIHEWLLWKFILKKKLYKPGEKDTLNDLVMDILGAFIFYVLEAIR
jgi:hypothetical protein